MPVPVKSLFDIKHAFETAGRTLVDVVGSVDAKGALVGLGKPFVDANSALAKIAAVFGSLGDSARTDFARVFTEAGFAKTDDSPKDDASATLIGNYGDNGSGGAGVDSGQNIA